MRPILVLGERSDERGEAEAALASRLPILFAKCEPGQVAQAVLAYEPEWTIGAKTPAPPDYIASGCAFIRNWIGKEFGEAVAKEVRII